MTAGLELRDDLIELFVGALDSVMAAEAVVHVANAKVLADALLERYAVEERNPRGSVETPAT